jgi:hypothetical protein
VVCGGVLVCFTRTVRSKNSYHLCKKEEQLAYLNLNLNVSFLILLVVAICYMLIVNCYMLIIFNVYASIYVRYLYASMFHTCLCYAKGSNPNT